MERILIVEDEIDIAELISLNLKRRGYEVLMALDGIQGEELACKELPDLILLDVMMPGKDGHQVLKALKRDPRTAKTPVIFLTAKAQLGDRITGLEGGADDYITKPFSPKELVLRVQAVLKRSSQQPGVVVAQSGPFKVDKNTLHFYLDGEIVELTSIEFKLLLYLLERPNLTQNRYDLFRQVWGYSDDVQSRTLDTHMKRLRQKLGEYSHYIETIRGEGYRFLTNPENGISLAE